MDQRSGSSLSWLSSQCHKAEKLTDYLPDDLVPRSDMIVTSSSKVFSGVTGLLFFPANGENRKSFATIGELDPWGKVKNLLWAVILRKVEEAWRSTGSISHTPSPFSCPRAQWGLASFSHLPTPERRFQASGEVCSKQTLMTSQSHAGD